MHVSASFDSLFAELNADRFESPALDDALARLGAPARLIRGFALARRRRYASARADARAALAARPGPHEQLVAGVLSFVGRDYGPAIATLQRLAGRGEAPAVALQANELAARFAGELGWLEEQRSLRLAQLSLRLPAEVQQRARAAASERELASRQRMLELAELPIEVAARKASSLLALDGPATAIAALDGLLEQHGQVPGLLHERIRIDLVLGRLDDAQARIAALPEQVHELFFVLRGALALARGDCNQVIVRTAHAHEPWPLLLRGEALLERGEFDEAGDVLERARVQVPDSVPITIALALARRQGSSIDRGEALARRFAALLESAPALLADAAALEQLELWADQGPTSEPDVQLTILARARRLLTAERDLWMGSYRLPGSSALRQLAPIEPDAARQVGRPSHLERLHRDDRQRIEQAEGWLFKALRIRPPAPAAAQRGPAIRSSNWTPRTLGAAEIEQFLTDGFAVVRGCFDRELAARWVADANRRIRDEPERWVRAYDPSDPSKSLRDYDPNRPDTWTWDRIDLQGNQTVVIEEFAPRAWGAILDLLGGPERIKTKTWTNYLIANFCADAHLDVPGPAPDWLSWHIDDPSPVTRLDRITNGLVGIALFSDLLPRSGNTWLAPDSVARVARELAAHPEGVDFCTNRGSSITVHCQRFHEVTGEAGDMLLMHPLMMHSASPNRSGRIRWMGNPMIYLERPLEPLRPIAELSPVELAIRRAIE